jgi:anti-anti-sigma factor
MKLTTRPIDLGLEVTVNGRVDSYWADHLMAALDEAVQQGSHYIRLDLADVEYMSSAGIGVLMRTYRRLSAIQGRLQIARPSAKVVKLLNVSGLATLLLGVTAPAADTTDAEARESSVERDGVQYTIYASAPGARLTCRVFGDAGRLEGCRFGAEDAAVLSIPTSSTVVGLGALGGEFAACERRFGEFLAVAGAASYLPTDGTGTPDYFVSAEASLPESTMLYGVACDGEFARLVRFETGREAAYVSLSKLVSDCLSLTEVETAGVVLVAESAGLVGAALRRSPATGEKPRAPFAHPEIREWLSFTSERVYSQSVVVAAGVATRVSSPKLAPMVRPLGEQDFPAGHIHAAVFTYTPLRRGLIGLRETVAGLYEKEKLQSVLHLLGDGRPITGAGESLLSRGACWIGPIDEVAGREGRSQ